MLRRPRSGLDTRQIGLLIALALVLTIWQHRSWARPTPGGRGVSAPEALAARLAWPAQRLFAAIGNGLYGVGSGLGQYRRLAEENRKLRAQNEELMAQKLRLTDAYFENQELRKLLGLAKRASGDPLVAEVIGMNYGPSRKRLTIEAPPGRALEVGNVVRTEAGLIGRVSEVSGRRAYVFPLIDAEHAVAGKVLRPPQDQGMVRVAAQPQHVPDLLVMDKLLGRANLREGDEVITSGMGGVYPGGIPIGTVVRLEKSSAGSMDLTAVIRPKVDFDHLTYVLVQRHGS